MSGAAGDVLELLLPEVRGARLECARKVTTFLRLVANDASARRATRVGLELEHARVELERGTRERIQGALSDLLVQHLGAARSADSFLSLPASHCDLQGAWGVLEEERAEHPWLAGVPLPGEAALEVAGRLLACARRLGLEARELGLWEARRRALAEGPRAGEEAFAALAGRAEALSPEALCGVVECLLERGAVRRARARLAEQPAREDEHAGLARLRAWVELLAGAPDPPTPAVPAARLPAALAALRSARREWLAPLAGRAARGRVQSFGARPGRSQVGAALLAVYALDEQGNAHWCEGDCAPARRESFADWCRAREDALREPGELEHAALSRAQPAFEHGLPGQAPRGTLAPATILAAAVVPVLERDGDPCGWLRLEFEHHLVPSLPALREFARAWRERVRWLRPCQVSAAQGVELPVREAAGQAFDARRQVLTALVEDLGLKTAQRRWWGLVPDAGGALLLCEGGGALADWRRHAGCARALRRTLSTLGQARFDEPDPNQALCAESKSGLTLPLRHGSRLVGVLVVESTRRRDLRDLDPLLSRSARPWAAELRVAAFRTWHHANFGLDPQFDLGVPGTAAWVELVLAAAAAREPVALCGAHGSGKRVLARWLHFESGRAAGPLVTHACGMRTDSEEEQLLWGAAGREAGRLGEARGGTLYLSDCERLAPACQTRLEAQLLARPAPAVARLIAGSTRPLSAGGLAVGLARRLERLELFVPGLSDRRDELPALIDALARRFARDLGRAAPSIADEVLACLWRQPWPGNLCELENVLYKLVLCARSEAIELCDLREVARRFRFELLARVSSREPDLALVECALRVTRNQCGTENRTRAALYLGWDPDTLARARAESGPPSL